MAKEICISSTPHETRLAILEDDQLAEIYYERENEYTLAGSIYNGRVTRVLPGMQSAFVDVGLERDAFLYVTDFLELEDQEETDELEKAAASGGNQAPREVRHTAPAPERTERSSRQDERAPRSGQKAEQETRTEQRQEQRQEPRPERPARDRRPVVEVEPAEADAADVPPQVYVSEQNAIDQEEAGEPGAKRWRGRRRRRGGRGGAAGSSEGQPQTGESLESYVEEVQEHEPEVAPEIHAAAGTQVESHRTPASSPAWAVAKETPAPRFEAAPAAFVLPGESLSKYGGTSADETSKPAEAAPARPASTYKPSTLIESPLQWDGSGLLPGESISRHRGHQPSPEAAPEPGREVDAEPHGVFSDAAGSQGDEEISSGATAAEELLPELAEDHLVQEERVSEELVEEELVEEELTASADEDPTKPSALPSDPEEYTVDTVIEQPSADETVASPMIRQDEVITEDEHDEPAPSEPAEPEPDATASHHVDPAAPTGFRLPFGLGKKKKDEEEAAAPAPKSASVPSVSAYAPGSGLIEEEVIEEEEFDAPRHHHGKAEEHDLDDFEEETLPPQLRTGDLGEMLQEAHLDHRIQLNFDDKNGEDEDEDEDDEPTAEGQPAPGGDGQSQQRRDRGGRGRRGRGASGAPAAPSQNRGRGPSRRSMQTSDLPIISDLLKPGQEILVQIAKEPIAKKGARITSHIALPGRFLVFMPTVSHVGVSRKIASDEERQRLKRILVHERGEASGGFIVRTAAEGATEEDLRADLRFLIHLWNEIKTRSDSSKSPALIYHDLSLIERILRDQVSSNFSNIWVDSEADYERIVRFLNRFSPTLVRRVKLYTKEVPLFEHFGIQDEISKALRSKVWLKSGGSIVINQTEALVAIDINTGKYVGKSSRLEDTIVKTNMDAVPEIVRQIRLRDLGGIIVIDFIDMDERKNRFKVLAALEEALKSDRAPTKVLQFNDFGLVAITRKRVKQSLERTLSVPCPTCQATGMVKSPTTVCNEIYTELRKMRKHFEGADVLLRVHPETVKVLKSNNASWLTEFEELVGKNILVKSDAAIHPEQFDIQG
jgi:ribonuclease G